MLVLSLFLIMIFVGGLVGWMGASLMGVRTGFGTNILLGMAGGLLGTLLMWILHLPGYGRFGLLHFLMAILGAALIVGLAKALR